MLGSTSRAFTKETIMKDKSEIQCPNCSGKIIINSSLLIKGGSFSCTTASCNTSVSLSNSSYQVANNAMKEFEKVRANNLSH